MAVRKATKSAAKKPVKKATKKTAAKKATVKKPKRVTAAPKRVVKKSVKKATKKVSKKVAKKAPARKTVAKKTTAKQVKRAPVKKVAKKVASKGAVKKKVIKKVAKKPASKTTKPVKAVKKRALPKKTTKKSVVMKQTVDYLEINVEPYHIKRGEAYMNDEQVAHFKTILNDLKQSLLTKIMATATHIKNDSVHVADMNDRASMEEEFSLELRARDRERKLISKIEEALKALEEGEYGYCEECGEEIGIRRLEARPTAALCIDCKTLSEIKERQTGV